MEEAGLQKGREEGQQVQDIPEPDDHAQFELRLLVVSVQKISPCKD